MVVATADLSRDSQQYSLEMVEGATGGERLPLVAGAFAFPALCELERDLEP